MKSHFKFKGLQKHIHPDIWFLQTRLEYLIKTEQYERAYVVKKWIDELNQIHKPTM